MESGAAHWLSQASSLAWRIQLSQAGSDEKKKREAKTLRGSLKLVDIKLPNKPWSTKDELRAGNENFR
jgi:hypothetical protein